MEISIQISPEKGEILRQRALAEGKDLGSYLSSIVEQVASNPRTFRELAVPFGQAFRQSGATEAELDAVIEEEREERWQEAQKAR